MNESEVRIAEENECMKSEENGKKGIAFDNSGVAVVEIILILVVLIALVLIFKEQLGNMVTNAMKTLEKSINEVLS